MQWKWSTRTWTDFSVYPLGIDAWNNELQIYTWKSTCEVKSSQTFIFYKMQPAWKSSVHERLRYPAFINRQKPCQRCSGISPNKLSQSMIQILSAQSSKPILKPLYSDKFCLFCCVLATFRQHNSDCTMCAAYSCWLFSFKFLPCICKSFTLCLYQEVVLFRLLVWVTITCAQWRIYA